MWVSDLYHLFGVSSIEMKCKEIFQMVGKPIETSKRRITADKREIKDFPKPSQGGTSFMMEPLGERAAKLVKIILKE